jgi:hypothetical protein
MTMTEQGFKFENGEQVDTVNLAHASFSWLQAFGMVMLDGRPLPVSEVGDALAVGVINAVGATVKTGGLPTNLYAMLGGRRKVGLAPVDEQLLPEAAWCALARAAYAHELRSAAEKEGARWVLNLAFEFGDVRPVTGAPPEVSEVEVDGSAPHLLMRVTAFDLADNTALRWWAKAAPTGDPDRPLHLLPVDQRVGRREWNWMDRFSEALRGDTAALDDLLGPVEMPSRRQALGGQVDLRTGAYDDLVRSMRSLGSGAAVATLLAEACHDLRLKPAALVAALVRWGGTEMLRALRPGVDVLAAIEGDDDEVDVPAGRGMRA